MVTQTQNATTSQQEKDSKKAGNVIQDAQKRLAPVIGFFTKFSNDWAMSFAGMLAYSLLTALLPIAIALLSILGFVLGGNKGLHDTVINTVQNLFPGAQDISQIAIKQVDKFTREAGFLAIIAIVLALFGGSRLFLAFEGCMDIIYRVRPRTFLRQNGMAFSMLFLFIILVPIMVFASLAPSLVLGALRNAPLIRNVPGIGLAVSVGGYLGGLLAGFIFFLAIYIVVPNQRVSFKNSWCGALVSAVALEFFLAFVFPFYTANFLGGYTGQILFAVVILLFLYYFAVILLLGAEVNAYFFEKVRPIPNDIATFISTAAGELNKDIPSVESKSHVDPQATISAGKQYIVGVHKDREQEKKRNAKKQQEIVATPTGEGAQEKQKEAEKAKKQERRNSRLVTTAEVVAGSALAFVISFLRLRRKG